MAEVLIDTKQRIFIGVPIPINSLKSVQASFQEYQQYISSPITPAKWHLTILYLGEINNPKQYYSRLRKPVSLSFVPTVRITHIGRGLNKHQLWAYVEDSVILNNIRGELVRRLKSMRFNFADTTELGDGFVPHIAIANLFRMAGGVGLADYPLTLSFAVTQAHIFRSTLAGESTTYHIEDTIPFTQ